MRIQDAVSCLFGLIGLSLTYLPSFHSKRSDIACPSTSHSFIPCLFSHLFNYASPSSLFRFLLLPINALIVDSSVNQSVYFYQLDNTLIILTSLFGGFCSKCSSISLGLITYFEVDSLKFALVIGSSAGTECSLVKYGVAV